MDAEVKSRQAGRIAEWLGSLLVPGQVVEVRALHPFASRTFATAEAGALAALARFAAGHSGTAKGVYFTPNPLTSVIGSGKGGTHLDADVGTRHWLLADFDPARPKDSNATAAERGAALAAARAVQDTLTCRGFGGMVLGDSGNGAHLMIPVDLANDTEAREWHRLFLRHLGERFGTEAVTVDPTTHNAARIWKLPATLAMKGPDTPERPHRYARLIDVPESPRRFAAGNVAALKKLLDDWGRSSRWSRAAVADDRAVLIRRALAYLEKEPPAVSGQRGHDRCFHVACVLVCRFGLTPDEAFAAIQPWNARCQPPWSEAELRHKLADADKEPKPLDLAGSGPAANGATPGPVAVRPATPESWEPPIPLSELPPAEPFPVDVFPGALQQFVSEASWAMGVAPDAIGVPLLAVAGGAIGNSCRVMVKDGYTESAALYAAFVAPPGSTKSSALAAVARPLFDAETTYALEYRVKVQKWEAAPDGEDRPVKRRCVTSSGTVEGIARLLADNPRGLALVLDELTSLVHGMNQYKQGGRGNDRQFYLSCWTQAPYRAERVDQDRSLSLDRPFLSIIGAIPPAVLDDLRGEDGFLDRFLVTYPEWVAERAEDWGGVSQASRDAWDSSVRGLLSLPSSGQPAYLPLSLTGRTAYQEFTARQADEVNADDFPDHLRGPWRKLRGYCLRLALILHGLDAACDGLDEQAVDGCAVERATRLVTYFKAHARRVGVAINADRQVSNARNVLRWLAHHDQPVIRFRDLYLSVRSKGRFPDVDSLRATLTFLTKHGFLRPQEKGSVGSVGGRPASQIYEVNPLCDLSLYATHKTLKTHKTSAGD